MKLKWLLFAYVLFLIGVSVLADTALLPDLHDLLRFFAPHTWLTQHVPHKIPYGDKLGHFALAGLLSLLVNLALRLATFPIGRFNMLKGTLFLLVFATLEEGSQAWFPNRTLSLSDLLANYAGILCFGYLALWLVNHRRLIESKLPRPIVGMLWP
jgi:polysaccharide biosynthesis protein VpsQ